MPVPDLDARLRALVDHESTLLVEAGAGSGKTALMAGRVVLMLAYGIATRNIAAITFTELAAGELLSRISEYLDDLIAGRMPVGLDIALPEGITDAQRTNLEDARLAIGELTCTTIHGFCQALIRPYPVEANIDPGARIMDPAGAALAYADEQRLLLRERLDRDDADGALAAFAISAGDATERKLSDIAEFKRGHRTAVAFPASNVMTACTALETALADFDNWFRSQAVREATTEALLVEFAEALAAWRALLGTDAEPAIMSLMQAALTPILCGAFTQKITWRSWGRKGKWQSVAAAEGLSKAEGGRISDTGSTYYEAIGGAWSELLGAIDSAAFAALAGELDEVLDRYAEYKRAAALLDFDDLLLTARRLLREQGPVRQALGERYRHILVDEFQDTDPVQAEILWLLAGDAATEGDWSERKLRAGALFCVGDPKQAIYRFRGADVDTYVKAREAIRRDLPDNILSITANFRSMAPVLEWVNEHFAEPLAALGQPGFEDLVPTCKSTEGRAGVVALAVATDAEGVVADLREVEANAIASLCQRLIGSYRLEKSREDPIVKAGDIALLAPAGTQLWRYERALERVGIPVASQAGKGFFRRQEIQDLIAITRVLADKRDTVALGAFLRGPLVGLSEEKLLDIVDALPAEEGSERTPSLYLWTAPEQISHAICREVLEILQGLARRANSGTPFELMATAVEELRVRPILRQRHPGGAERALANVDLYLEMALPYAVRGLKSLATDMRMRWEDAESQIEGRPDAEEQAVHLITMHSAKGLEWPVVIPINTLSRPRSVSGLLHDRVHDTIHGSVGPVAHASYQQIRDAETAQLDRERLRLLYVACTRAEELLVLPNTGQTNPWLGMLDLDFDNIPVFDDSGLTDDLPPAAAEHGNLQSRATFADEAASISKVTRPIRWIQPSRHEGAPDTAAELIEPEVYVAEEAPTPSVRGSPTRGTLLHKLFEEVLTGELESTETALEARATDFIEQLDLAIAPDSARGLVPAELAATVLRGLSIPGVSALRARLVPELNVYGYEVGDETSEATAVSGVADALVLGDDGQVEFVLDWKSDVDPSKAQRALYKKQVAHYMKLTGAKQGLVAYVTPGFVDTVT